MDTKHSKNCLGLESPEQQNPIATPDTGKQPDGNTNDALSLTNECLPNIIHCHDGLLDELFKRGVLDQKQVQINKSMTNDRRLASQLLEDVRKLSSDKKEQFLAALDDTQQSHVSNNRQQPATTYDDNCPGACYEFMRVEGKWARLLELMDSRSGLCNELLSARCIDSSRKEFLDQLKVMAQRNACLLVEMVQGSREKFKKFIDCLIKTKQQHVAALLDPDLPQHVLPIDEKQLDSLISNYAVLVQLIELKRSDLLSELLSANVITWYQKDFIESASTASESKERLLDCMKRASQHDYDNFIKCLDKTGQEHVADLLRSDGVVVEMITETSRSQAEEDAIVEQFFKYYRNTSTQKRQQLCDRLLDGLKDTQLIAMQTQHSIKLFFVCESLSGLLHLNELYSTKKLDIVIQQLFTALLNDEQPVNVRLNWDGSNYNICLQHLASSYGLSVYSQLHLQAQQHFKPGVITTQPSVFPQDRNERLPHELIELLIVKTAGKLYVELTKMTSRADVYTLTTLNSVCRFWWETLTYRQNNRRLLRHFFEHTCAPYSFKPKLINRLCIERSVIYGVAELDGKLFIVDRTSKVRVRSLVDYSFCELDDLKIHEFRHELNITVDIVACSMTRCLYISEPLGRCIWRVNLASSLNATSVDKFITLDYEPYSLSIQSNRLLVIGNGGRALYIHSCGDGALLRKIEENNDHVIDDNDDETQPNIDRLLRFVDIIHAVETTDGRLIVSYGPRDFGDTEHRSGVSEVSPNGQVLRTYEGATEIIFSFLTVDSRNHILACDELSRRIIRLDSKLVFQQVILTELAWIPCYVRYSEQTGLLYICYYASPNIDVYDTGRRGSC